MPFTRNERRRLIAWLIGLAISVGGLLGTTNLYRHSGAMFRLFWTALQTERKADGEVQTVRGYVDLRVDTGTVYLQRLCVEPGFDDFKHYNLTGWSAYFVTLAHAPIWAPLIGWIGVIALIVWRIRIVLRSRSARQTAHCTHCGYDLRATPERCPECGTRRVAE
jgi:hypothetical protein